MIDLVIGMCLIEFLRKNICDRLIDTVTLKRKFGFAVLCVAAEGTGKRCSESQKVEKRNLLIYFWRVKKFVFFNSEQILRLLIKKQKPIWYEYLINCFQIF